MKRKITYLLLCVFVLSLLLNTTVKAAGANITFSTKEDTVVKGEKILVNIHVTSEVEIGDFETFISYNSDVLEFVEGNSFIAGGEGLLKLSHTNVLEGEKERKYVLEFKAIRIGKGEIAIDGKPEIYDFETNTNMSVSSNRMTVEVVPEEKASNNSNLKELKISPAVADFKFEKEKTEYKFTVENSITKLIISAKPEDEKSSVTVDGDINLKEGDNLISLVVKAESGDITTYTLEVTRLKGEETGEDGETVLGENAVIGKVEVIQVEEKRYIQNGYRYQIPEEGLTEELIQEYSLQDYKEISYKIGEMEITAYEKEGEEDFLLLYLMNESGETGLYQYDKKENTLQRYIVQPVVEEPDTVPTIEEEMITKKEANSRIKNYRIAVIILSVAVTLLTIGGIAALWYYHKQKGNHSK